MIFDFVGRLLPRWIVLFSPRALGGVAILRFVFFILFPLCIKPRVLDNDAFAYILMILLAFTNGYCGTLSMMYGPKDVNPEEKEYAGIIMSFSLNVGIFIAVHFALLLLYILEGAVA